MNSQDSDYDTKPECNRRLGDYELLEVLGRGSFATVWEARHSRLGRHAALKVLTKSRTNTKDGERFLREAQLVANLRHPNIVNVLEIGQADGANGSQDFVAFELVEGVNLAEWMSYSQLGYVELARLCAKLVSAMDCAHASQIIHRDLKPENILVDLSGEPHVTDFGLARKLDDRLTEQNISIGTVAYMSPEQSRGDSYIADERSDIYSLGVILFELLTGELPFRGSTIPAYLAQLSGGEARLPSSINANIPRDLSTICAKCLRHEPADRYQSASELQADLERFADGRTVLARQTGMVERFRKWCVRQPIAAALLGLVLSLAIAGPWTAARQAQLRRAIEQRNSLLQESSRKLSQRQKQLDATNQSLREANYSTNLFLAYQAWNQGRVTQTREHLDRGIPLKQEADLRGFAWNLLNERTELAYQIVTQSSRPIDQFCFSADRRLFFFSDSSDKISVWNSIDKKPLPSIKLNTEDYHAITCSMDRLYVGSKVPGHARLSAFDLKRFKQVSTLALPTEKTIETIQISPDENLIAIGVRNDAIYLCNSEMKISKRILNHGRHSDLLFSPDGKYLVASFHTRSTHENGILLIDTETFKTTKRSELSSKVVSIAWTSTSENFVAYNKDAYGIRLQAPDLKSVYQLGKLPRKPKAVQVSDDDSIIYAGCQNGAMLAQTLASGGSNSAISEFYPHAAAVTRVELVSENKLVSSGRDGTIVASRADIVNSQNSLPIGSCGKDGQLAYSKELNRIVIAGRDGIFWEREKAVGRVDAAVTKLLWLPAREQLACGLLDGRILLVNDTNFEIEATLPAPKMNSNVEVRDFESYDNGNWLIVGYSKQYVHFWDVDRGTMKFGKKLRSSTLSMSIHEPLSLGLVCASGETIDVFDLNERKMIATLPIGDARDLLAHPTLPLLISGHKDSSIRVWNLETLSLVTTLRGHEYEVYSLALHHDGRTLASGDSKGTIRLWDLKRLKPIGVAFAGKPSSRATQLEFPNNATAIFMLGPTTDFRSELIKIGATGF